MGKHPSVTNVAAIVIIPLDLPNTKDQNIDW